MSANNTTIDHSLKYRSSNTKNLDARRRNRRDTTIQLRKEKREDNLSKRRNINISANDSLEGDVDYELHDDFENVDPAGDGLGGKVTNLVKILEEENSKESSVSGPISEEKLNQQFPNLLNLDQIVSSIFKNGLILEQVYEEIV